MSGTSHQRTVVLREVRTDDLAYLDAHQRQPEANRMAVFAPREHEAFMAHWHKAMEEPTNILRTIVSEKEVAGNIVCWIESDRRKVGYWLGKNFWGKGIATAALQQFLQQVTDRPLFAHVAKRNVASMRVLQKCGFRVTSQATIRDLDGNDEQEFIFSLDSTASNAR